MSQQVLTSSSLDQIHKIILVKFALNLSQAQLLKLIDVQPVELQQALKADKVELAALDQLVESVSEKITGMNYPTEHSTPYYKEYFKKKLKENTESYFGVA